MEQKRVVRHAAGVITIAIVAGLIYTDSVSPTIGITVIVGVLAGLGIFEGSRFLRGGSSKK